MGPSIPRQPHRSEGANSHGAKAMLRQMRVHRISLRAAESFFDGRYERIFYINEEVIYIRISY